MVLKILEDFTTEVLHSSTNVKVPINWLKEYIDFSNDEELMAKLTSIGHMQDGPPVKVGETQVYDLEVRQNRPDCLSLIGIAREAGAVLDKKVKYPQVNLYKQQAGRTRVEIVDPKLCYRFNTVTIEGLKVAESPQWLKEKLNAYGIKTVNNLVDITNFVMVEVGQPLHAFDRAKIKDEILVMRPAKKGESLVLLGDKKVELTQDDLVIADAEKPLGLGGVMGGKDSSVDSSTTSIILECATYNQAVVRRTSLRHQVRTEASTRLEKFLHPKLTEVALQRAVDLILKECGGSIVATTDVYPKKFEEATVKLTIDRLNTLGGVKFTQKQAEDMLKKLELEVDTDLTVKIPYFRTDLELEEDLVEEVLRIYGYDRVPSELPSNPPPKNIDSNTLILEEQLRDLYIRAGLDEQITEPLTSEENPVLNPVLLENSLNADKTMLRTTLRGGLANSLNNQLKFRKEKVQLFEIGKIYFYEGKKTSERSMLGVMTYGTDYFEVKGLMDLINDHFETKLKSNDHFVEIIDDNTYFFELPLEAVVRAKVKKPKTNPPHVIFQDISFFVPPDTKVGEIIQDVSNTSSLVSKVELGEEPTTTNDLKTVFLHLQFESSEKNLTKEIVDMEKKTILAALESKFKAKVR